MAVTQKRLNRAQPLLAGERRPNMFLTGPWERAVRSEARKVSLQVLQGLEAGLQQVAELLFLLTGLHRLPPSDRLIFWRNKTQERCKELKLPRHCLYALCQCSDTNLSARKMQLLSSPILIHSECPKWQQNCIVLPSCHQPSCIQVSPFEMTTRFPNSKQLFPFHKIFSPGFPGIHNTPTLMTWDFSFLH